MKFAEKVLPGHPDKLADQISDSILDHILGLDSNGRGAIETLISSGPNTYVVIAGETNINYEYDHVDHLIQRILGKRVNIINLIGKQSPEIAGRVIRDKVYAGDQGVVVGYATNETLEMLPLEFVLAKRVAEEMYFRSTGHQLSDGKVLVSLDYQGRQPTAYFTISWCHQPGKENQTIILANDIIDEICRYFKVKNGSKHIINPPDGSWTFGGPQADTGLTGRKIIADAYGPMVTHGGGAVSGKDFSKVDRLGAYYARWLARQIVKMGYTKACFVKLTYAMGGDRPIDVAFYADKKNPKILKFLVDQTREKSVDDIRKQFYTGYLQNWTFNHLAKFGSFGNIPFVNGLEWEK